MKVIRQQWREKVVMTYLDLIPLCDHYCEICGTRSNLTAHHIRERRNGGTDDLENLMCLCRYHHKKIHERTHNHNKNIKRIYQLLIQIRKLKRELQKK